MDDLKDITDNFGTKALIGEGSYGRVYHGVLKSGQAAAIKKLDSSKQPDQEFLAQVCPIMNLSVNHSTSCCSSSDFPLLGPCLSRFLWFQGLKTTTSSSYLVIVWMAAFAYLLMSMHRMDLFMIFFMVRSV